MPETMMPGRSGLLVPPNDPGALAQALDLLLGDAALRRRMGERAGRACATWACSHRRAWRRTWKIYHRWLSERRGRRRGSALTPLVQCQSSAFMASTRRSR